MKVKRVPISRVAICLIAVALVIGVFVEYRFHLVNGFLNLSKNQQKLFTQKINQPIQDEKNTYDLKSPPGSVEVKIINIPPVPAYCDRPKGCVQRPDRGLVELNADEHVFNDGKGNGTIQWIDFDPPSTTVRFDNIPPGKYRVGIMMTNLMHRMGEVTVISGKTTYLEVSPAEEIQYF